MDEHRRAAASRCRRSCCRECRPTCRGLLRSRRRSNYGCWRRRGHCRCRAWLLFNGVTREEAELPARLVLRAQGESHATSIGFKWGFSRSLTEVALDDLDPS